MMHECYRCGHEFKDSDLSLYDGELLCDDCEDEVKSQQMCMSDVG